MKKLTILIVLLIVFVSAYCEGNLTSIDSDLLSNSSMKPLPTGDQGDDTLKLINYYREIAHLPPVTIEAEISDHCLDHLEYMIENQELTHYQDEANLFFTETGAMAAQESLLADNVKGMYDAVESWMNSLYHRIPLLEPGLKTIGFAYGNGYAVLNVSAGFETPVDEYEPIFFPANNQQDIPCSFHVTEEPNPIPEDLIAPIGSFITVLFSPKVDLLDTFSSAIYSSSTEEVLHVQSFISTMKNVLVLIPEKPLQPSTTYFIDLTVTVDGEDQFYHWKFTTGHQTLPTYFASNN